MSKTSHEAWVYDQEHPNEKFYSEGALRFPKPSFLKPIPAELMFKGDERTDDEKDKENDKFLKQHGL